MASIIGFLIGSISSNVRDANNYAVLINLPAGFFSGQNIPMKMIKESNLSQISKFVPFSYPVDIISRAFYHYNLSEVENSLLFTDYLKPIIFALL
jgi:ABC-type multidrug transport system permease subunit